MKNLRQLRGHKIRTKATDWIGDSATLKVQILVEEIERRLCTCSFSLKNEFESRNDSLMIAFSGIFGESKFWTKDPKYFFKIKYPGARLKFSFETLKKEVNPVVF